MNAHIPQSVEAATELREIAAVPKQLISPRLAKPLVSVVQDTLVGVNRLTRPSEFFTRREFMNLLVHSKRWDGRIPPPAKSDPLPLWSGLQVVSALLPAVYLEMGNKMWDEAKGKTDPNYVIIHNGEIKQGILDGDIFDKALIHILYNDFGPEVTVDFLDSLQAVVAAYLQNSGFSVGLSDLIADTDTLNIIGTDLTTLKKQIESLQLQIHTGLFDNTSGRTNQEEFEMKVFETLNKAISAAGKTGLKSLIAANRMVNMVRCGSKGSDLNIAQMIALLGQQSIEGKRIAYGFQDRTLPHFKRYDDGADARGFIESSFVKGLSPAEFFFHAMTGREGLIDTAVKSVTGDTPVVIIEDGIPRRVTIGSWIDAHLSARPADVEHFEERNMEMLQLSSPAFIPTVDGPGNVSWGEIKAVTRHDPGTTLFKVKTAAGKSVTVTESQSLLIYHADSSTFERMTASEVRPGHFVPTTASLPEPPMLIASLPMDKYLPKEKYLYGTDFHKANTLMEVAMEGRERIPAGWWGTMNGNAFKLPYTNKARLQRALIRSNMENIKEGYVYPFSSNREHTLIPDTFTLSEENGLFMGLFLAEGNVDIRSGYVQITNNDPVIRKFVSDWFSSLGIKWNEHIKTNHIGGTSSDVRGFSTVLAQFLTQLVGHGAANKHIPAEFFAAPIPFIRGLLNGYFSGDGTVSENSVEVGSASSELIEGISMLCTRMGIFGKVFMTQLKSNNIGTETIAPTHRLSIRAQWASKFAENIPLIDASKQKRLDTLSASESHRNFAAQKDVVLDEIVEITPLDASAHPKVYDLTVPSTWNFGLANGLHVVDTADSGYMQRQLVKTMEDLMTYHDGTVRDAGGLIVQFAYGDDGTSATKVENQPIGLAKMTDTEIRDKFSVPDVAADKSQAYLAAIFRDRDILVHNVWGGRVEGSVQSAVHLRRLIGDAIQQLALTPGQGVPVPGAHVLDTIDRIHERTRSDNELWGALLRFYLNPRELQARGFTRAAFDWLAEQIVVRHMKTWVAPGEMAGIIAAQSIGEPTTQLTLNSVDWDTGIIIARDGKIWTPQIGQFIDDYIAECEKTAPERIQRLDNDQLYVSLDGDGHDWQAISCDEDGKMQWTKLEAITKHPVINADGTNTILEVELESGRTVKATKAKSFLRLEGGKIVGCNGSDLKIGDLIPIANDLCIGDLPTIDTLSLREVLPATEWLYGSEVEAALAAMHEADSKGNRHWFSHANGNTFTVPYARSDSFRDAFTKGKNSHLPAIVPGNAYPKKLGKTITQIPETIVLDRLFGFFCGAYLAEGNSNTTQVMITNNDITYLHPICGLMDAWKVGYHIVSCDKHCEKTGIKGHSQSLIIHSTLLAAVMQRLFGRVSYEKTFPDWVFQAPDDFVKGLVDGYISGDGCVSLGVRSIRVCVTSVSKELIERFAMLMSRYEIFTTQSTRTPPIGVFASVRQEYTLTLLSHFAYRFAELFDLIIAYKQERLNSVLETGRQPAFRRPTMETVVLDKVKTITEIAPIGDRVYDVTVEKTRNFTCKTLVCSADTFHLSGVAAKSGMTRGVPRIKELFKVTQNPRATSLTIYLRPDIRQSKEHARRLAQELEFTMLKDLVSKSRIYYDPRDSATLIEEDKEWLTFFSLFEQEVEPASASEETDDDGAAPADGKSPWIIRLELDREKMFSKNITMEDIEYVLRNAAGGAIKMTYTDHNASNLIFRIRIVPDEKNKPAPLDYLTTVKAMQTKLLTQTLVRGLPGLRAVSFRKVPDELYERNPDNDGKYEPVEQFVLDTFGTNFLDVLIHPDVDGSRLISNHVHDINENLGIEAARQILFREIFTLFAEAAPVNYRHIMLLVDAMSNRGRLMSADRHGTQKKKIGPLAKASFEQAEDIMLRAALFGEMDPVTGVSANIMTGQPIRGGTTFSQVLLDEAALAELVATAPPPRRMIERAPQLAQEQVEAILEAPDKPGCRQEDIRIPAALPPMDPGVAVATTLPDLEIIYTDE